MASAFSELGWAAILVAERPRRPVNRDAAAGCWSAATARVAIAPPDVPVAYRRVAASREAAAPNRQSTVKPSGKDAP